MAKSKKSTPEYQAISGALGEVAFIEQLNALSADGWEVISICIWNATQYAYLKKG